jgi:hypothetical protein
MLLRISAPTLLIPLAFAVACSSEVDKVDGSGGSGGSGSGNVSSTTDSGTSSVATTTSTTTVATSTSTTSGGNQCEQGCQHVIDCIGFDGCSQLNVDCTNPMYECPGTCLNDATCQQIGTLASQNPDPALAACLQACQGMGTGGGGVGGGMQGGTCQMCAQNACQQQIGACFQNNACQAWLQCVSQCSDGACVADCDAMNPNAAPQSTAVKDCACTQCDMQCGAQIGCGTGTGGAGAGGAPTP